MKKLRYVSYRVSNSLDFADYILVLVLTCSAAPLAYGKLAFESRGFMRRISLERLLHRWCCLYLSQGFNAWLALFLMWKVTYDHCLDPLRITKWWSFKSIIPTTSSSSRFSQLFLIKLGYLHERSFPWFGYPESLGFVWLVVLKNYELINLSLFDLLYFNPVQFTVVTITDNHIVSCLAIRSFFKMVHGYLSSPTLYTQWSQNNNDTVTIHNVVTGNSLIFFAVLLFLMIYIKLLCFKFTETNPSLWSCHPLNT